MPHVEEDERYLAVVGDFLDAHDQPHDRIPTRRSAHELTSSAQRRSPSVPPSR